MKEYKIVSRNSIMEKRKCGWKGCKETIEIDTSFEKDNVGRSMGITVIGWCNYHSRLYNKQCDMFEKLLPEYNKKQIKNKFGRVRRFTHHSEVSNYLFQYNRKEFDRLCNIINL